MLFNSCVKYLTLLSLKINIKIQFIRLVFVTAILTLSNSATAQSYEGFSCENGNEVSLGVPVGIGGWGDVAALTDNNAWSVWGANYPSLATASMDLGSPQTISQVSVFENVFLQGTQTIDISLIKVNGSSENIQIDLVNDAPQNQWHNKYNLNIPNVTSIVFSRDHASENVAQIKVCNKQNTSSLSIGDIEVTEGNTASFSVTGSGNFTYSVDFNNSTNMNDFTGSLTGSGTAPLIIDIQTNDDGLSESTETFNLNLSTGSNILATAQGTILDNDNSSGCKFKADTNLQDCLPWDVNDGVYVDVNQNMYLRWRLLAVHKDPNDPNMSITSNIATYGQPSNGTNCFVRHDKYWTLGDDGFAYHTWHPADDGICTYGHEHGDDPHPANIANSGDQYLDPKTGIRRQSQAFEYAKGRYGNSYPPFGFAMAVYNRNVNDSNAPSKKRREDHFGHKVIVANGIRMAIGEPQNIGSEIYDTGIRCDWYSKIHQGSFSPDALTNNMHEYFLNVVCNDGAPVQSDHPKLYNNILASRSDVTKFSIKTMLNWGNPYLINELGGATRVCEKDNSNPLSCALSSIENANIWRADIPRKNNYDSVSVSKYNPKKYQTNYSNLLGFECSMWNNMNGSDPYFSAVWEKLARKDLNLPDCTNKRKEISSKLTKLWLQPNGTPILDDIPKLDTKPSPLALDYNESGSRDFELFSGFLWKNNWDQWFTNGNNGFNNDGISTPELWSGPSGNEFKTFIEGGLEEGGLKFAPYYIIKNPSRMLSTANNGLVELERTVELCKSANVDRAFCKGINSTSDWRSSKVFNGSVRALNFKAIHLNNLGGKSEWCSNAFGENIATINGNTCSNTLKQIRQKASTIENGWQGYGNRQRTVCDTSGEHCGEAIVGTIERWSIDKQNGQWIIERKKAQKNPNNSSPAAYIGAGMGYEWIINHGNDNGVQVPN